jgi:cholesterol oxidase
MPRSTCRLCGECDLGCNDGSKNTLDYTYLTAAIHQPKPADVRPLCEVKRIAPRDGARGYRVEYLCHDPERPRPKGEQALSTVTCDLLILAAGTFGTPFLLMKNRAAFPGLSATLGSRYCVNGDLLSFIVRATERRDGAAVARRLDPSFGPVITSAIRFADSLDGHGDVGRGFYVEDGGHPYLLSWFAELSGLLGYLRRSLHFLRLVAAYRLGWSADADLGAEISTLIGDATTSASSMPVLSMGRDVPSARLFLRDGRLDCDWRIADSADYYERVRRSVREIASALGARYMDNPSFSWNFRQVLTAHPLGGCPMAETDRDGVVDPRGQVFGHPDLYIADGSVLPGPVGPNPSLTIAALADRFADGIVGASSGGGP